MKARVTKKWWQFWLPEYIEINDLDLIPIDNTTTVAEYGGLTPAAPGTVDKMLNHSAVVEANEAQPWYSDKPQQPSGGAIVEAVPDIVAKSQGNQIMHERLEQNGR